MSVLLTRKEDKPKSMPRAAEPPGQPRGLIFRVQAHSVHDGPGCRTTVFLNGCPLKCLWCSNPEGQYTRPVILWSDARCVRCGKCIDACPHNAVYITDDRTGLARDRTLCSICETQECLGACLNEGVALSGEYYSIDDLMRIFHRDRTFWGSKGGVTFSGGEPLFQKNFMSAMLPECKKAFIHVTIETTLFVSTDFLFDVAGYIDWVFCDIKHMEPAVHKKVTGVDNKLILKNIQLLASDPQWNGFMIVRIPVIPGINDYEENIRETAKYVRSCDLEAINILPFHRLGEMKYRQLDMEYKLRGVDAPTEERMQKVKGWIEDEGIVCFVGHNTPF